MTADLDLSASRVREPPGLRLRRRQEAAEAPASVPPLDHFVTAVAEAGHGWPPVTDDVPMPAEWRRTESHRGVSHRPDPIPEPEPAPVSAPGSGVESEAGRGPAWEPVPQRRDEPLQEPVPGGGPSLRPDPERPTDLLRRDRGDLLRAGTAGRGAVAPDDAEERRPALAGIGALAVTLIIGSATGAVPDGHVGIGVVLVVVGLLLGDAVHREVFQGPGTGARRLLTYYSARCRDLGPILAVNLVATAIVHRGIAGVGSDGETAASLGAAGLMVANLRNAATETASGIGVGPADHHWVIAVIVQMAVILPWLFIFGLVRFGRRRITAVVVGCIVASGAISVALAIGAADRIQGGTAVRAHQLLLGALLAFVLRRWSPGPDAARKGERISWALIVLIVLLATGVLGIPASVGGALAAAGAVALIPALAASPTGSASKVLSAPTARFLGGIAFGTYLWHHPVQQVLDATWSLGPSATFPATLAISAGLAALFHGLVTEPMRRAPSAPRLDGAMIVTTVVAMAIIGLVLSSIA